MNILEYFSNFRIIQIGCGGTGSWLVPLVSKLVNSIRNTRIRPDQSIRYILIDHDIVEERNILRQNFTPYDIGKSKAQSLVNRYLFSFDDIQCADIEIKTAKSLLNNSSYSLELSNHNSLVLFLGCVDNNKSRHLVLKAMDLLKDPGISSIYIDGGNNLHNGQVLTVCSSLEGFELTKSEVNIKELTTEEITKKCKLFEKKQKVRYRKFKKILPKDEIVVREEGCLFFGDQSQAINNMSSAIIFCNLQNILINNDIPPFETKFNSSGWASFEI